MVVPSAVLLLNQHASLGSMASHIPLSGLEEWLFRGMCCCGSIALICDSLVCLSQQSDARCGVFESMLHCPQERSYKDFFPNTKKEVEKERTLLNANESRPISFTSLQVNEQFCLFSSGGAARTFRQGMQIFWGNSTS